MKLINDIKNGYPHTGHGKRNITEEGLRKSAAKLLPRDTVLLTSRAPIGYVAIASQEVSTNQGFKNLIFLLAGKNKKAKRIHIKNR